MPVSNLPVGMSSVVAEFGGPGTLSSYLRGGAYVQDTITNAGVSAVLPMSLSSLAGATKPAYNLSGGSDAPTGVGTVYAGFMVKSDGTVWFQGGSFAFNGRHAAATDWVIPNELNGEYVRLDVTSGAVPVGSSSAVGVWLPLTSNRSWYIFDSGTGGGTGHWRIRIARDSAGTDIVADSNPGEYLVFPQNTQ